MSRAVRRTSRAAGREREHFIDAARAERDHQQPVEAERDAGAGRQAGIERGEQTLVDLRHRQPALRALLPVTLEARTLLRARGKLPESVRELDPVAVELEPQRDPRIIGTKLGERG